MLNKNRKKMVALLIGGAILAGVFGGGGSVMAAEVSEPGEIPIVQEQITLKVLMGTGDGNVDLDPEKNTALKELENRTGIKLEIETVTDTDQATRVQTMFASGDYPDILWGIDLTTSNLAKYGEQEGYLIPLNDLMEKDGYYIYEALKEMPDALKGLTLESGNIYGFPQMEVSHVNYSNKMWLNYEWLDKLGLDVPKTTDDFYNVLLAFKNDDPNGNGIADEIPLTSTLKTWQGDPSSFILNAFCPYYQLEGTRYLYNDNGTVKTVASMEDYREGLRYMHKLYAEGLLDPSTFTQERDEMIALTTQDTKVVGSMSAGHLLAVTDVSNYENEKPYKALDPLVGPNGRQVAAYSGGLIPSVAKIAITDKCENPEAAFKLLDYIYSDDYAVLDYAGAEGTGVETLPDDTDLVTANGTKAKYKKISQYNTEGYVTDYMALQPAHLGDAYYSGLFALEIPKEEWTQANAVGDVLNLITKEQYEPYGKREECLEGLVYTSEENDELAQLWVSLKTYLDDARIQFISGTMDLDSDWDAYVDNVENGDMKRVIEINQAAYDRAN